MALPEQHLPESGSQETPFLMADDLDLERVSEIVGGIPERDITGLINLSWDNALQRNRKVESSKIGFNPAPEGSQQEKGKRLLYVKVGQLTTSIGDFGVVVNNKDRYIAFIAPHSAQEMLIGFLVTQNGVETLGGPASIYNPDFLRAGQFAVAQNSVKENI